MSARIATAAAVVALFGASLATTPARADEWPTRPVRILIPFTAGGTADTLGRIAAEKLSAAFGQQFVLRTSPARAA